ncbi:homeobox protein Hox-D11a isoform X2 [Kryptolebias marmoratus]|uniref:homeobox protein Hox-D11a isoform X2 n=1 Tax=Kryptolebias marmoratus TaxID=37003 RepID=UPI0018AD03C7|nr:homeobox protein Hox-D11a isoform X2 [Kryptolebias marmoratus]
MYGNFLAGSHDTITSRIDQDVLQVCLRFRFFLPAGLFPRARGAPWTKFNTASLPTPRFLCRTEGKARGDMTEYDDRSCASNMFLPSCTYYVSTPDFPPVSSFLPQTTSCQINFPYSPSIAQPVREVAFRDYGLDHPKWHYRGNYASYYSTEEIMHRELIHSSSSSSSSGGGGGGGGGRADVRFKNESLYGHPGGSSAQCGFFAGVGRNGVLPQGFDQFFDSPHSEKPVSAEPPKQKTDSAAPGDGADVSQALTKLEEKQHAEPTGSVDEDSSSSNCGDRSNRQKQLRVAGFDLYP